MFISCVYLSGYSNNVPITGHTDIKTDSGQIQINFTEDECRAIQEIVVDAYNRKANEMVRELQEKTPALVMIAPPTPEIEEVEFNSVDEDIPF